MTTTTMTTMMMRAALLVLMAARLDAAKNPTLKSSPHQLWVAYKDGAPTGRVAAIINKAHLEYHHDNTGHFGFLEAVDDPDIMNALIETASAWVRGQGMESIGGPYNFSVNEECGLLIDGFDTPPYVLMPHGRPYYGGHLERLGFQKAMDMYALEYYPVRQFIPEKRQRFIEKALAKPNVSNAPQTGRSEWSNWNRAGRLRLAGSRRSTSGVAWRVAHNEIG